MLLVLARICSLTFVVPSVRLPVTVPLRPGLTDLVMLFGKGDNSKVSSPREDGGSSMPNPMRSVQNGKDDFQARPMHALWRGGSPRCHRGCPSHEGSRRHAVHSIAHASLLQQASPFTSRHRGAKASWVHGERARHHCR